MKIIDLLNKIANGEELPKLENEVEKDFSYYVYDKWGDTCNLEDLKKILNDEVEIIEEPQEHKIPEKLTIGVNVCDEIHINNEIYGERQVRVVADKINEILDYLEEL